MLFVRTYKEINVELYSNLKNLINQRLKACAYFQAIILQVISRFYRIKWNQVYLNENQQTNINTSKPGIQAGTV